MGPAQEQAERSWTYSVKNACTLLESIRHPNIVQYLPMTVDPEYRLPVLLMELLNENLTNMLECSQQSIPYYIQVDICHDIALAVSAYLHLNNIIHRDLSTNNVLIIAGRRAKVTNFWTQKLCCGPQWPASLYPLTLYVSSSLWRSYLYTERIG